MARQRIVVVGAGIAGLTAANRLLAATEAEVVVLEAAGRAGGVALTEHRGTTLFEWGPEAVADTPAVRATLGELGLDVVAGGSPGGSLLWLNGSLRPLPVQLAVGAVPSPADAIALVRGGVLPVTSLLRMALEPLMAARRRPPGTLADSFGRRFGRRATARLIAPFAEGVLGAPADVLADSVVPRPSDSSLVLASLRQSVRRAAPHGDRGPATGGLVAIAGGMGRLVEVLSRPLDVALGERVHALERLPDGTIGVLTDRRDLVADAVVVAVAAPAAGGLLPGVSIRAAESLAQVRCGSSAVIYVDVVPEHRDRLSALAASGWLGAPEDHPAVAAASFVGLKWPHLDCPGRVRAVVRRPDLLEAGDARLLQAALDEMERVLAVPLMRKGAQLRHWRYAVPIRTPEAAQRVADAKVALPSNVALVGAAEACSGVTSAIASGRRGADRLDIGRGRGHPPGELRADRLRAH